MYRTFTGGQCNRRGFLAAGGALGAASLWSQMSTSNAAASLLSPTPGPAKQPARVAVVFLYPPADVVYAGKMEDAWQKHQWFTWPGNQFEPEQQERKFTEKIRDMAEGLGVDVEFAPAAIYQEAKVNEFIEQAKARQPDAVLVVNFWNTLSKAAFRIATESAPTGIVYHSVGSNHQLPPDYLRNAEGIYYIHSIENWDEIQRGLRAVRAKKMLAQSRMLRVSGQQQSMTRDVEKKLNVDVVTIPAEEFNSIFDATQQDDAIVRSAMEFKNLAARVTDVADEYFVQAMRAHRTVSQVMERYEADAITIECLFLETSQAVRQLCDQQWQPGPLRMREPSGRDLDIDAGALAAGSGRFFAQSRIRHE